MKHFFAALLVAVVSLGTASAQTLPPSPPSNLQGQALRDWLRQNWYDGRRVDLGYDAARGKMYNYVDNTQNEIVCVYSGYAIPRPIDSTSTSTAGMGRINCEHTIPQSWFNEVSRMKSDIHHLYPTYDTWNSNRGSDPFGEIPDAQTQLWMRGAVSQTTIPTTNIAEWSEDTNTMFEPREDHKGNVARAAFYFYTMHAGQAFDPGKEQITALAALNTLYQWHQADPVDARERERNRRAAKSQGNFNPYIADPALVAKAWGFAPAGPTVSFATASGSIAEGNTGTSTYTLTLNVSPAPTSTLTVQVLADAANSTATSPDDYTFSTQTVTFAAGQTAQTVTVTVNGDTQPEIDEVVRLTLQNASAGLDLGSPNTHSLTITNDDGQPSTVNFASAAGSIAEGNTGTSTYTVNVVLSGAAPSGAFTVPVAVDAAGSTATAADYTLNTTSLSFAAGVTSLPVQITVVGDAVAEPNETVRLRLGQPSGGGVVAGTTGTHTLTITNDDVPAPGAPCSRPFFSEYIESGPGINTKVIEIYNPSTAPLNLTGHRVVLYANGATTATSTLNLTGTIAPGDVFVVSTNDADAAVLAQADVTNSGVVFFNGDDAIALFNGTDTLDVIGVIGVDPGTSWTIPGGGATLDNTLVRRPTVTSGNTRWSTAAAEWQPAGVNSFGNVGRHTSSVCATVTSNTKAAPLGVGLDVYPNPAAEQVQLRVPALRGRHTAEVALYNALGQRVLSQQQVLNGAEAASLTLQGLPVGLYSVRVTVDGVQYSSRLAVRR